MDVRAPNRLDRALELFERLVVVAERIADVVDRDNKPAKKPKPQRARRPLTPEESARVDADADRRARNLRIASGR